MTETEQTDDDGEAAFLEQAAYIIALGANMLNEHFGERCLEYEPGCEICERWRALDRLTQGW